MITNPLFYLKSVAKIQTIFLKKVVKLSEKVYNLSF